MVVNFKAVRYNKVIHFWFGSGLPGANGALGPKMIM